MLFKLEDIPEMDRGRGATLQKYKYGGLSDVSAYVRKEGLTWKLGEKTRTETALGDWIGQCAQAGRLPPTDPRRTTSSVERAARARGVQR